MTKVNAQTDVSQQRRLARRPRIRFTILSNTCQVMKSATPDYLADIPQSEKGIEQGLLDIENKERRNLLAWNGQFSPQLVEVLLETYAPKHATVLDLFAGSGTVLHECGRQKLQGIGTEINPAAFYLARVYTLINLSPSERARRVESLDRALSPTLMGGLELWSARNGNPRTGPIKQTLIDLRDALSESSEQVLADALVVIADFQRLQTTTDVAKAWNKLKLIVRDLPYSSAALSVFNCDARCLPIQQDSVDMVITSPPYINVFNYHQQYRASAEALGWDSLAIARSEIGSNRKHRGNRFLTVVQYCLDITMALSEVNRVCKPSARVVFVVGRESTVRGVRFFNGEIVGRLASKCTSLRVDSRQERSFRNRFGNMIVEDILHIELLQRRKHSDLFNLADARAVAADILQRGLAGVLDPEVVADIHEALDKIEDVQPSPTFSLESARKAPDKA
jgi:hypothetical protein